MKKLFLFLAMASTTMFVSCGSDDSDSTPAATSITLTASATSINLGQPVTLSVKDNNGNAVTTGVTFHDGATVVTSPYTPTTPGVHSITAKSGNLTSAAVEVTVNVGANSVFANGTSSVTDKSIMYYLGSTAEGNNVFVANSYNQVGTGQTATYPNDVYVYFTATQEAGSEFLTLPELGNYAFGAVTAGKVTFDANVIIGDVEILETEVTTDASWNLSAISVTEAAQTWAYTYAIKLANGSFVYGDYNGEFGFSDETQARAAARPAGVTSGTKLKVVTLTNDQIEANFKAIVARKK